MKQHLGFKVFLGLVIAAVVAAIVGGLLVAGTPSQERARQFDSRRINDIQQITNAIDQYWTRNKKLPGDLSEFANLRDYYVPTITDPRTGAAYEYRVIGDASYELCATFETDATTDAAMKTYPQPYAVPVGSNFWRHGVGRTCFSPTPTEIPGLVSGLLQK